MKICRAALPFALPAVHSSLVVVRTQNKERWLLYEVDDFARDVA